MGWDFTQGATKAEIVERLSRDWTGTDGVVNKRIARCIKGNIIPKRLILSEEGR